MLPELKRTIIRVNNLVEVLAQLTKIASRHGWSVTLRVVVMLVALQLPILAVAVGAYMKATGTG